MFGKQTNHLIKNWKQLSLEINVENRIKRKWVKASYVILNCPDLRLEKEVVKFHQIAQKKTETKMGNAATSKKGDSAENGKRSIKSKKFSCP